MLLSAKRIVFGGYAYENAGIEISPEGRIKSIAPLSVLGIPDVVLEDKVLLPGFVNAHSQSFMRLLKGRLRFKAPQEYGEHSLFEHNMMHVANALGPDELYTVARQAFVEMLMSGITSVGEFHVLHHQPDGTPYTEPHVMAMSLVEAARDAGIRMSLLHVAYLHDQFQSVQQQHARFAEKNIEVVHSRFEEFVKQLLQVKDMRIAWGIGAYGLGPVRFDEVISLKLRLSHMPFHIKLAERGEDVTDCLEEFGKRPIELLAKAQAFDACSALIHCNHITDAEARMIARSGSIVCVTPGTDAEKGSGMHKAGTLFEQGVKVALGTGICAGQSMLNETMLLDATESMRRMQRNILSTDNVASVASHVHDMATVFGAKSLGLETGVLRGRKWADVIAFDMNDPRLAGTDDWTLLPALMFGDGFRPTDVMVAGQFVVRDGVYQPHDIQAIRHDFEALSSRIFATQGN